MLSVLVGSTAMMLLRLRMKSQNWGSAMVSGEGLAIEPGDPSSSLRASRVEGENWCLQSVLCLTFPVYVAHSQHIK